MSSCLAWLISFVHTGTAMIIAVLVVPCLRVRNKQLLWVEVITATDPLIKGHLLMLVVLEKLRQVFQFMWVTLPVDSLDLTFIIL